MKPALAVLFNAENPKHFDAERRAIAKLIAPHSIANDYARVYVIMVAHGGKKEWDPKGLFSGLPKAQVSVFWPDTLAKGYSSKQLGDYLREVLFESIAFKAGHERLDFLWRADWVDAMLAIVGLESSTSQVQWLAAPDENDRIPTIREGYRYRDLLRPPAADSALGRLRGGSPSMVRLREELRQAARLDVPVLLVGETGTGKELCAQALHEASGRRGRFVPVNAALLHPDHAVSILFGHVKGAFTGADKKRDGRIVESRHGTFFLDEAGDLPRTVQAQFLRAIQKVEEGVIHVMPMGASDTDGVRVSTRMISAMQHDPLDADGFRIDLYHRLSWIRIDLPPLRNRDDDARELAEAELARLTKHMGRGPQTFTSEASASFADSKFHTWPGNVRELHKVVFRAWFRALCEEREEIDKITLRAAIDRSVIAHSHTNDLRADVARLVRTRVDDAMGQSPDNKSAAARSLGFKTGQEMERYARRCEKRAEQE